MKENTIENEKRVFGETAAGTKVEVVGKRINAAGEVVFYDVKKDRNDCTFQITPQDLTIKE